MISAIGWSKPIHHPHHSSPEVLFSQRTNSAIALRHPPHLEYITAFESACHKLNQQDAKELNADINRVLGGSDSPSPISTRQSNKP